MKEITMKRQIGVDFGTTTSVVCYRDIGSNEITEVKFNQQQSYDLTMVREADGSPRFTTPKYGWNAFAESNNKDLLKQNFKMDLLNSDKTVKNKAIELTKEYFKHLRKMYSNTYDERDESEDITMVTYPEKFTKEAQKILLEAAKEAGFPNVNLVKEAQAVMEYALIRDTERLANITKTITDRPWRVMMVDMGAGTTDIIIFEYDTKSPKVKIITFYPDSSDTCNFCGNGIDDILYKYYHDILGDSIINKYPDSENGKIMFRRIIKQYKEVSSSEFEWRSPSNKLPSEFSYSPRAKDLKLTEEILEDLLKDYLPNLTKLIDGAVKAANLKTNDIDVVYLTGGNSRWYFLHDLMKNTGLKNILTFDNSSQLVVARGAALYEEKSAETVEKLKKIFDIGVGADDTKKVELPELRARVMRDDSKYGFINQYGEFAFHGFDEARDFSEGLAAVRKGEKWGFIDKTGKFVIEPQYDDAGDFSEGFASVGRKYKSTKYSSTYDARTDDTCNSWRCEGEETIILTKWGFVDKKGKICIDYMYDNRLYPPKFLEGVAVVVKDGTKGFVNKEGRFVSLGDIDECGDFHEEMAIVIKNGVFKDKRGAIDKTGNLVIPFTGISNILLFSEGLAAVQKGKKWGFIDKTGEIVIEPQYDDASSFSEGLARVKKIINTVLLIKMVAL